MKDTDFITASSYIRTLENRLLTKSKLDSLITIHDFSDILKGLSQDMDYNFISVKNSDQAEAVLKQEWKRVCELLYKISPHKEAVQIALLPYEFHLLRQNLKEEMPQSTQTNVLSGEMKKIQVEAEKINESNQVKEIFLDKKMFEHMIKLSEELNSAFIIEQVQMKIDFYNIKSMLRAREIKNESSFMEFCYVKGGRLSKDVFLSNYLAPLSTVSASFANKYYSEEIKKGLESYEINHNFSDLETSFRNILIDHLKHAKLISYGPEIIIRISWQKRMRYGR